MSKTQELVDLMQATVNTLLILGQTNYFASDREPLRAAIKDEGAKAERERIIAMLDSRSGVTLALCAWNEDRGEYCRPLIGAELRAALEAKP